MSKKKTPSTAVLAALENIEMLEKRIVALSFAMRDPGRMSEDKEADRAFGILYGILHVRLARAYQNAAMFALFSADEDVKAEVKKKVWKSYFREGMEIMSYLSPSGRSPGRYAASEHDEWRAVLNEMADNLRFDEKYRPEVGPEDEDNE